jgi:hypothetical protein
MNGSVTVRQAEDLEGGALTFAEIARKSHE